MEDAYPHLHSTFVVQHVREGIAHALWMAREHIEDEDEILIALGDTIFDMDMKDFMKIPHSSLGVKKVDDPRRFGVVETGENGYIQRLVEKPSVPVSNMALVGIYKIKEVRALFDAIKYNIDHNIRTKEEFQLTDAMMRMIEKGVQMTTYPVENWFDCGKKEALLETNAILLSRPGYVTHISEKYKDSIIIPPVNIDETCEISHSIIGPNVSIGARAQINHSIIKESIIGPEADIEHAVLQNSLIGNESSLRGLIQSLNLGDSTEINYE
jgi:glucose-1-phosphate thymidylyltransferase